MKTSKGIEQKQHQKCVITAETTVEAKPKKSEIYAFFPMNYFSLRKANFPFLRRRIQSGNFAFALML